MRKLVTKRIISQIDPIPDADKIECAHIDGWKVTVSKGEFKAGDEVFYFEVDSMLPLDNPLFSFLEPHGVTIDSETNIKYHRLHTKKFRGQYSQGLIIPFDNSYKANEDGDYSEAFRVIKYEAPIPMEQLGELKGFPGWISKTDEERIQNFTPELLEEVFENKEDWVATEKIDGISITFYARGNEDGHLESGVCTHKFEIIENDHNIYWKIFKRPMINIYGEGIVSIQKYLEMRCLADVMCTGNRTPSYVIQGELFGEGIQQNRYKQKGQHVRFYNFIKNSVRLNFSELDKFLELKEWWVPIINFDNIKVMKDLETLINSPDKVQSQICPELKQIEGIVWCNKNNLFFKDKCTKASFKTLSNRYLLKYE